MDPSWINGSTKIERPPALSLEPTLPADPELFGGFSRSGSDSLGWKEVRLWLLKRWKNARKTDPMGLVPSRKLTYPTWGKGKSSSNMPHRGDMLIPWRVYLMNGLHLWQLLVNLPVLWILWDGDCLERGNRNVWLEINIVSRIVQMFFEAVMCPRDPTTFWDWQWNLNTFLRRWLYTPIIIWEGDWILRGEYWNLSKYSSNKSPRSKHFWQSQWCPWVSYYYRGCRGYGGQSCLTKGR